MLQPVKITLPLPDGLAALADDASEQAVAQYLARRQAAKDREAFDQAMARLLPDGGDPWLHAPDVEG